jgi:DNA-binding NtrC family response regulator
VTARPPPGLIFKRKDAMIKKRRTIVFIDDETDILHALTRLFHDEDYEVFSFTSAEEAIAFIVRRPVDLVICDYFLKGMNGIDFFEKLNARDIKTVNILITGKPEISMAVDAVNRAVLYKIILKPWDNEIFKLTVRRALEQCDLLLENQALSSKIKKQEGLLKTLEQQHPDIFTFKRDASGYIIVEE